ncbi:MAG TPA: hypothetical protein VGR74_08790 [Actinomycetota bacterium]|jgi:hypothetical protein|nr:hypothetical protein [Actinomycetota bacterium]
MRDLGYVIAGYLVTVAALGGYVLRLLARARRARQRAAALADRRAHAARAGR